MLRCRILAPRGKLTGNVRVIRGAVAGNEAVSDHQLTSPVTDAVPDAPSTMGGAIAGNGAKGYRCLGGVNQIGYPATERRCAIAGSAAADKLQGTIVVDAPTTATGTRSGNRATSNVYTNIG